MDGYWKATGKNTASWTKADRSSTERDGGGEYCTEGSGYD